MEDLDAFIERARFRFATEHNNTFAFAFGKVSRYYGFLEIIRARYQEASKAFLANTNARLHAIPLGQHAMTPEERELCLAGGRLQELAHLEIESFYLFAKILLDHVARALEYYFGAARGLALDSHDDLTKRLERYCQARGLSQPSSELLTAIQALKVQVSDYRDYDISHEKSPRSLHATTWDVDGGVHRMITRYNPKDKDPQTESETPEALLVLIQGYIRGVIPFVEANRDQTNLELEKPRA